MTLTVKVSREFPLLLLLLVVVLVFVNKWQLIMDTTYSMLLPTSRVS
jgi:hypothetical protein